MADGAEDAPGVELLHGVPVTRSGSQVVLHPDRDGYPELVDQLRSAGFWVCADLCAVDYLTYDAPRGLPVGVDAERFEVVVGLIDPSSRQRLRIRVQVPGDEPTVSSISPIHPSAEAPEREAYDLFGVIFEGHPHLSRILLPDEWEGHPLRKDVPVGAIPVQFKATREIRS
ncbi:MAG: NADH-quinone oxidoreductase subunit C [Microthrixaceae bacterium]